MEVTKICVLLITTVLHCNGIGIFEQLAHITRRKSDSLIGIPKVKRRFAGESVILGAPRDPHHLPAADAILPGHTLIRPAVGMLKSAVKFPHREQENGAGVYGHIDNLGIKYAGKNERVMYSGFRRSLPGLQLGSLEPTQNYEMNNVKDSRKPYWLRSGNEEKLQLVKNRYQQYEPSGYFIIITKNQDKQDRLQSLQKKRGTAMAKAALSDSIDIKDFLRIIQSLRRDQDLDLAVKQSKTYIPGRVGLGSYVITQGEPEEGEYNRTKLFWQTQDSFNHIKVNPEAPELTDLLPEQSSDNARNWWFYNQEDFEEFEDR